MRVLLSDVLLLPEEGPKGRQDSESCRSICVDIGIEDGVITSIDEHPGAGDGDRFHTDLHQGRWDQVIIGRGRLVLPGLVNAHTHLGMSVLRGYGDDLPLMVWLQEKMWPMEDQLTADDVYWASLLAIGEMLRGGVTTCGDMYFHMEAAALAVVEAGIRASLSRGLQGLGGSGHRGLEEAVRLCQNWHHGAGGRITTMLGPHAPFTCPPGFLREVVEWAGHLAVPLHIHVAETADEVAQIREQYGTTPLGMLDQCGVLDLPVMAVHCVHFSESDLDLAVEKGIRVVHCPGSNMKLGSGIAPLPRMIEAGLVVGLGTDSAASNNKLDLWEEMRFASLIHKASTHDATAVPAVTAFQMATLGGAAALFLDKVGKIRPGWAADLVLVNAEGLHWQPFINPIMSVVYAGQHSDVSLTMVAGKVLYEDGKLLTIDEDMVRHQVNLTAHRLGLLR